MPQCSKKEKEQKTNQKAINRNNDLYGSPTIKLYPQVSHQA